MIARATFLAIALSASIALAQAPENAPAPPPADPGTEQKAPAPSEATPAPSAPPEPRVVRTVEPQRGEPLVSVRMEHPPAKPRLKDEDGEPRFSLPTEADRVAWRRPGFRLGLAFAYGELAGLGGAPSGRLMGGKLRAGLRLDDEWSLVTSFEYTLASRTGGLSGMRFAGTLDPTWHVTPSVSVALGFGFGGIVEGTPGRMDASPLPGELETSYTFPDASTPMRACSGVGAAGLARVEYAYVIGPRASATIALEAIGQWTGCVDDTGRVEPDTGQAIVRRQYWPHAGATLALGVAWR